MGRMVSLFFSEAIPAEEFVRVAVSLGARIQDEQLGDFGFSEGAAHVWIYEGFGGLDDLREQPDGYHYPLPFGNPSKAHFHMALGHELESAALALRLAVAFLHEWPGVAYLPLYTALVRGESADALPQTVAEGVGGFEVQVVVPQQPTLGSLISEFGGIVFNENSADLSADAIATLAKQSRADATRDVAIGVIEIDRGYLWVLVREFDPVGVGNWDLLAPIVERHVRPPRPSFVIRVLIEGSPYDHETMELAQVRLLSFSRRVLLMQESVLLGTFFVELYAEQVKWVIDSGQWRLMR